MLRISFNEALLFSKRKSISRLLRDTGFYSGLKGIETKTQLLTTRVQEHGPLSASVINKARLLFIDHLVCDAVNPPNSLTIFFWWQREKMRLPEN